MYLQYHVYLYPVVQLLLLLLLVPNHDSTGKISTLSKKLAKELVDKYADEHLRVKKATGQASVGAQSCREDVEKKYQAFEEECERYICNSNSSSSNLLLSCSTKSDFASTRNAIEHVKLLVEAKKPCSDAMTEAERRMSALKVEIQQCNKSSDKLNNTVSKSISHASEGT